MCASLNGLPSVLITVLQFVNKPKYKHIDIFNGVKRERERERWRESQRARDRQSKKERFTYLYINIYIFLG